VYLLNIETGQREIVGNFPGMTFSPRFSPDGQRIIMSLPQDGKSNLFVMDLRSKATLGTMRFVGGRDRFFATDERILTEGYDNNVVGSPTFAPNGRMVMFFRYPGGSAGPALYTIDLTGHNEFWVPTLSFARDPDWSPLLPRS
jgi:TolB protein